MKILISPGFGAGWSTWAHGEVSRFVLTYQPIIEFLEAGGDTQDDKMDELVEQLSNEIKEKFPDDPYFYGGGKLDLVVREVEPPFYIHEYDGSESIRYPSSDNWITE
jgi:hypothetical protein